MVEHSLAEIRSILARLDPEVRAQVLVEVLRQNALVEAGDLSQPQRAFRLSHGCFAATGQEQFISSPV